VATGTELTWEPGEPGSTGCAPITRTVPDPSPSSTASVVAHWSRTSPRAAPQQNAGVAHLIPRAAPARGVAVHAVPDPQKIGDRLGWNHHTNYRRLKAGVAMRVRASGSTTERLPVASKFGMMPRGM
jgi:hypothetical protein